MKILILTYGSRGDVQPYVALGRGLQKAGHHVTLATSVRFRDFVQEHGLDYGYLNDDLLSIIDTDEGKDLLENGSNIFAMARRGIKVAKMLKPAQKALLRESWAIAQEFKPDFILFHSKGAAAPHIAEKLGIGCALATPIPMFVPTGEYPFLIFPNLKVGKWFNRFSYHLIRFVTNKVWAKYAADFRAEIGLPPVKKFDFLKMADGSDIPVLHGHSEAVLPFPSDWPEDAYVTGYWFLDDGADWAPPVELQAFLDEGDPPVYVGFGSMAGRDPERLAGIVIEALQKAGLRGIIATGWGGLRAEDLPESILKIDGAPHDGLFPRMAAVVHHGGAGTSAAGLRAGKPSVILPFFADQPFWGRCVYDLGAGPKPILQKRLSANSLAVALTEATGSSDMIKVAAEIGEKIRREDGVANAVSIIEKLATNNNTYG